MKKVTKLPFAMITDRNWEATCIPIQGHGHVHECQSAVPQTKYFRSRREISFTCLYSSTLVVAPLLVSIAM